MLITSMFPSEFLKAGDLQGHDVDVIMDRVELKEVGKDKEQKPVLYFQGKQKGLVLNKTNANSVAKNYGPDASKWRGQKITLFPAWTDFGGDTVECIRIRPQLPLNYAAPVPQNGGPPPGHPAAFDDEVPFAPNFL